MTCISLNILQWLPLSNPNRGEDGTPKTMPLAGSRRGRISSQSVKRQMRVTMPGLLGEDAVSVRTRRLPFDAMKILAARGWDEREAAARVLAAFGALGSDGFAMTLSKQGKKAQAEEDAEAIDLDAEAFGAYAGTTQVIIPAPRAAAQTIADIVNEFWNEIEPVDLTKPAAKGKIGASKGANKLMVEKLREALAPRGQVDTALFGRFVTELPDGKADAAMMVSHAMTTHPDDFTIDYWTAVDDRAATQGHGGAAGIGRLGLTSGVYHRSMVLDVDALANNEHIDERILANAVEAAVRCFIGYSPRAMKNSTNPTIAPFLVLATVGDTQRNLSDAFITPVEDYVAESVEAMAKTYNGWVTAYTPAVESFVVSARPDADATLFTEATALATIEELVASTVRAALAEKVVSR